MAPNLEGEKTFKLEEVYKPSEKILDSIWESYDHYMTWKSLKENAYKQFNGSNLLDWLQNSREKFWGYKPLYEDPDTVNFFFPETRNNVILMLSKLVSMKLKPSFEGVEGFDIIKATILQDLFESYLRGGNRKLNTLWQQLYQLINGTLITHVAYESRKRDIKTITKYDPSTGETLYKVDKLDDSDIEETICNLEDIFIPKIWEPDMQKQRKVIWRTLLKFDDFKNDFKDYDNVDLVHSGMQFADSSIYADYLAYDVRSGDFVELLKEYDTDKDEYKMIANGVLLNPIKVLGNDECAPLPWNHKELPFAKSVWEPIDANFFYGMSLPQKVRSSQEALNEMMELILERERRYAASPIITSDPNAENGIQFKAGNIYQVGDINAYKELTINPTGNSTWNLVTVLQSLMGRTSAGGTGPTLPSRQPRSATEKAAEGEQQKEQAGLYFFFFEDFMKQKTWLVLKNMVQFYTTSQIEKEIGTKKYNKIIALNDIKLVSGGVGSREIRITESPSKSKDLEKESWARSLLGKEKVEIIEVTPQTIRDMNFDIKVSFEPENSPATERALYIDFITFLLNSFGQTQMLDPKKMLFRIADKFNENPSDFFQDQILSEYESDRFGNTKVSQLPAVNQQNQALRGQMFGAQGPMNMPTNQPKQEKIL